MCVDQELHYLQVDFTVAVERFLELTEYRLTNPVIFVNIKNRDNFRYLLQYEYLPRVMCLDLSLSVNLAARLRGLTFREERPTLPPEKFNDLRDAL